MNDDVISAAGVREGVFSGVDHLESCKVKGIFFTFGLLSTA